MFQVLIYLRTWHLGLFFYIELKAILLFGGSNNVG